MQWHHDPNRASSCVDRGDHLMIVHRVKSQIEVPVAGETLEQILTLLASFLIVGA